FGPVGFQLRLVECLFAYEHHVCRHDFLLDVLDSSYRSPPDATMISPVSHPESSEARNTTTLAMSAGVPIRPKGVRARKCFSNSLPVPSRPAAARVPSLKV